MGFGEASPKIYMKQQIKGYNREMMERDVFKKLGKLAGAGYYWDAADLKLKRTGNKGIVPYTPWFHGMTSHKVNCYFDHHLAFEHFEIIPPKCLRCWKVCMGLPNFKALMEMKEIIEQAPFPCKCGMEMRDYTPKHYGAYFYNTSFEEGREKYEIVKQLVEENLTNGKEIAKGIILKRGCTEYEMIKGPSPFWHMTPKEEEMYDLLTAHVESQKSNHRQFYAIQNHVVQWWILWAHANGDMSYLPWNGGEKLFPDYVTYHEGDIEGIKYDLQQALWSKRPDLMPVDLPEHLAPKEEEEMPEAKPAEVPDMPPFDNSVIGEEDELT